MVLAQSLLFVYAVALQLTTRKEMGNCERSNPMRALPWLFPIIMFLVYLIGSRGRPDIKSALKSQIKERNKTMKRMLMLTIAYSALLAASGQDARQAIAKFNESNTYALEGRRLLNANKPEEALKAFQLAAQLNPDNRMAVSGQCSSLVQLNRVKEAAKILDDYVAAKPGDSGRWWLRAIAQCFEMDQDEEALKSFTKLAELEPNNWEPWNFRGKILVGLKRYDDAIKSYDKVVELGPHEWGSSFYDRACAYAGKGDKINALADLKTAIQLQSSLKAEAAKEDLFSSLRDDPDFKKLLESKQERLALIPSKPKALSVRDMDRLMGQWVGKLDGPGDVVYTIILRFEKTKDGKFISVADCPEQNGYGDALTEVFVDGDQLTWKFPPTHGSYIGKIKGNTITGTYTAVGTSAALNVTKSSGKPKPIVTQMKMPPDAMKNLLGRWKGTLGTPGKFEVVFRFERNAGKDAVFVDFPVQLTTGIPAITVSLIEDTLWLRMITGAEYNGILNGNKIEGAYKYTGQGDSIPLTLTKE
jgi:tetratricopeptide (TPR) repeat protein